MKKVLIFTFIILGLLLSLNSASAQQTVQSATYPAAPSADKPVIWVVTTPSLRDPARVSWHTLGAPASGSFDKISDTKWFCYFADDTTATCGQTPFSGAGTTSVSYIVRIKSPQLSMDTNTSSISLSSINTQSVTYDSASKTAYMLSSEFDSSTATVTYSVLSSSNLAEVRKGDTNYTLGKGFNVDFSGNPLPNGKYFIVFDLTKKSDQKKGGSISYFEIGSTGQSATPQPISSGSNRLEADPVSIEATANQSDTVESSLLTIRNLFNDTVTNLTASFPTSIGQSSQVHFLNTTIGANKEAKYTIQITNVQADLNWETKFNITGISGGNTTTIEIPLKAKVDVIVPQQVIVDSEKAILDLGPTFFSEKLIAGKAFSGKINVKNLGKGKLSNFNVEYRGLSKDAVQVSLPSQEILPGAQANIMINASPATGQRYTGSVLIKSNGGEKEVWIDLEAFDDISSDVDILQANVNARVANITGKGFTEKEAKDLFSGVIADISASKSSWDAGKYSDSRASYNLAQGKLGEIESFLSLGKKPSTGGGLDILLPLIIIVIIIVIALVGFKKIKSKKAAAPEEYTDEEYAEGQEEPGGGQ